MSNHEPPEDLEVEEQNQSDHNETSSSVAEELVQNWESHSGSEDGSTEESDSSDEEAEADVDSYGTTTIRTNDVNVDQVWANVEASMGFTMLHDGIQTSSASSSYPQHAGEEQGKEEESGSEDQPQDRPLSLGSAQEQGKEETSKHEDKPQGDHSFPSSAQQQEQEGNHAPGDQPQDGSSSSPSPVTHIGEDEEIVIMNIRAKRPALGIRRLPAGFYTVVHHSGLEWRTENKRSSASDDVVEWSGPIPLPSDLSATVRLEVYASFEFQPMLGTGEHLRKLTITVDQLLDRSAEHVPFTFFPKNGDIVSSCSSILVTVKRRKGESSDSSPSTVLGPLGSITTARNELEDTTNHGHSALSRYRKHGGKPDLERSVAEFEWVLNHCPVDHPCRAVAQSNLAMAKLILCQVEDMVTSLEIPIHMYRDALAARPVGHTGRPSTLVQLAAVHLARLEKQKNNFDGARVEALLHEASELSSTDSHENRAVSFMVQLYAGHRAGPDHATDLQRAITLLQKLVKSVSNWDARYCAGLKNLGVALLWRFERLGELRDLEDAISTYRDAVHLTPDGHPDKPGRLNNLGHSFIARFEMPFRHTGMPARFERLGELRDLEDAISTYRDAVHLTPDGHPDKPSRLSNLGLSFVTCFKRLGELRDLEDAISLYSHSASVPIGSISVRFRASWNWILYARRVHHPSLLRAHSIAINLFPQLAWIGLSLTHRYAELKQGADVVCEAAAAALDEGFPELAVEWLEQGRSIVWGELLQLRGSYEQLSSAYPDHGRRLQELSAALDDAGATREKSLSTFLESTDNAMQRATQTLQQEAHRHRTLAMKRDKLLQEIRRLPGFERFFLPKDFLQLRASAHSGPVVMLNAAETRCDALILLADVDHVIHVPLPKFNLKRSMGLQNMLGRLLGDARATSFDDRTGRVATRGAGSWENLLSTLFNGVTKPVLDALAFSTVGDLSRIFWCPTGPFVFLPIHAAGLYATQYSSPGHKVSDFVVSSYIPTLGILTRSPNFSVPPSDDLRLLFVSQPPSDGQNHLQGVARELKQTSTVVGNSPSARTTLLESSVGTVEEVLGLMKDADWVHFACHGIQDAAKPTDSGLCLANGRRLKISDIIGLSRSRGGLAFLSACQTAMGDEGLTDEAIHIAAGMLFAGYGGVIGTMWPISDRLAPVVARGVYEYLFRNGTRPDHRDAARALHEAVGRLRESGEASFVTWVPFIHVGL
ncbi:CHAT domain-containing protein [Boletus edulis BED1]|uniref:CHAT domain-containing protein n=1 Tax=Boletus edulis BED1 TaxID=1328754 RepID=A0AAD4GCP7_BOLED|nr:CHAT domain-containing protein [Boletus edulis BED1]